MSKHLERERESINRRLLALFSLVEQMIDQAVQALCERQIEIVDQLLVTDRQVNDIEVEIEEECLKILALHQPVATDLRHMATVLKINGELERMADLACNIAERAQGLQSFPFFPTPQRLTDMVQQATTMVQMALDSFVSSDAELAKKVIFYDRAVDENNRLVIEELKDLMKQDADLIEPALNCFSASRHIERIADLAENIAEDVIYLVDGEIVRHQHGVFTQETSGWPNPQF